MSAIGVSEPIPEPLSEPDPVEGMPFDPWPTFTGDTVYHTWEEVLTELNQTAADHPEITKLVSIGQSWEGRDLWAMKISDNPELEEADEPEVFFNSNHHAREWLTIEIALYAIHFLTDNYGTNATVTDIVDNRQIWIIPVVNPDGRIIDSTGDDPADHVAQPYGWRKNARDNNGDEVFDIAADGVDLNRNYGYMWGSSGQESDPTSYTYGGLSGFSEPETQAIRDFCREHDFIFAVNYHTYSQLILYPWGWTYENTPDHDVFVSVAWELESRITNTVGSAHDGYVPEQGADLYPTSGGSDDWQYGELGIFAYTIEAFPYYDWDGGGPENHWSIQDPYDLFHPHNDTVLPVCQDNIHGIIYLCQIADNPFQVMDHVEISAQDEEIVIDRGTSDSTTIDLLNNGQRDDDFTITTSSISGWTITPSPISHNILRNQTVQSTLDITVPGAAAPGEYTIWLNVSSDTNSTCIDSCQVTVIVPFSDDVGTDSITPFIEQGTYPMGEYRIDGTVKNYGEFQVPSFDTTCTIYKFGGGTNYNLFSDDMESGMTQWVIEDWDGALTDDYWHIVNTRSNSPSNSMWCGPAGGGIYADYVAQFLVLADTIDLRNASSATLSYWSSYDIEYSYDFCVVEGSDDGGQTWEFITRYTGTENTWTERIHDLSNFTGSADFKLRFRFTSDGGTTAAGFWLDDVSVDAFIPGETIVYGPASLPTSGPLDPQNTEGLQWQYDFDTGGTYRVSIETGYGADGNPANDLMDVIFDIDPNIHLPGFTGIGEVFNPGTGTSLDISWEAANNPNTPIIYSLYRFDHEPDEAEVNASSAIWTGIALSYNDAGLTTGQPYYYLVRAMDDLGQQDWNMVVKNATPAIHLFLQVQSPFAGYKNLSDDPFELVIQTVDTGDITGPGQYKVGTGVNDSWVSELYAESKDMDGIWTFRMHGQLSNDLGAGFLYAKVFQHSDNSLLFQTGNDDEDVLVFMGTNHEFVWTNDVPPGTTLAANDRYYVEIWLNATAGNSGSSGTLTYVPNDPEFTATYWDVDGIPPEGTNLNGVEQAITAAAVSVSDDTRFNTIDPGNTDEIFVWNEVTVVADPATITQLDMTFEGQGNQATDFNLWALSTSGWAATGDTITCAADTDGTLTGSITVTPADYVIGGIFTWGVYQTDASDLIRIDFMETAVHYTISPPVFSLNYDHASTPSSISPVISTGAPPMTYDIDLTGISAGSWVFVSYPITSSGDPITIFDDATHGDANTTWDIIRWYDCNDTFDNWKSYDKNYPGTQDLTFADNTMGFWLHVTANNGDQVLSTGLGFQPATTSIILKAGWNMVGYPSDTPRQADATLPVQVTKIAVYNVLATPYLIEELPLASVTLTGGNAYWVYTPVVVQWDIDW